MNNKMNTLYPVIRNAVRAMVIRDGNILLLKKEDETGIRYALPGGGQDVGETLSESLQRECIEEINTRVSIVELVHVADFYKPRSSEPNTTRHMVEFLFYCQVPEDYVPQNGHHPDPHQVDVIWMALTTLADAPLFPISMAQRISQFLHQRDPVYLGVIS